MKNKCWCKWNVTRKAGLDARFRNDLTMGTVTFIHTCDLLPTWQVERGHGQKSAIKFSPCTKPKENKELWFHAVQVRQLPSKFSTFKKICRTICMIFHQICWFCMTWYILQFHRW